MKKKYVISRELGREVFHAGEEVPHHEKRRKGTVVSPGYRAVRRQPDALRPDIAVFDIREDRLPDWRAL